MRTEISKQERLARLICKVLLQRPSLPRRELLEVMAREAAAERRHGTRKHRVIVLEAVEPALEAAAANGWLFERDGDVRLTPDGEGIAKRTRAGRHVRREM